MLASSENSEINFSEMESSSLNPTDVKSFDLLQGDTGLRSVMEIAQNLSSRGDALTHNSMLDELFLMYSKDMVLQQSSNNQTIHGRLLSVITLAISREYMLNDQLIGKTRTFKMTPRGLSINLEKILSTEIFSERLSRMAKAFLESSKLSSGPDNNVESQHSNQENNEISSPGRTKRIDLENQTDDNSSVEKEQYNQAIIIDESVKSKTDDAVTTVEKETSTVCQNVETGSANDETHLLPTVCRRVDSTELTSIHLHSDSAKGNEEHETEDARLSRKKKKRVKQISAVTGEKVQDYLSVHDAARKMDIDLNTNTQFCEDNTEDFPPVESLRNVQQFISKAAASVSHVALLLEGGTTDDLQYPSDSNSIIAKQPARDPDLFSPRANATFKAITVQAQGSKTCSARSMSPVPTPPRAGHSPVSRPVEPITGQSYELLILAAMSKMSPLDHSCSWHPDDVALKLIDLFPKLMATSETSQQCRQILSYVRVISSTLRAASAGTLGCGYFSSEGIEDECRYRLTSEGRNAIEFFSVFSSGYEASSTSTTGSIRGPVQSSSAVINIPAGRTSTSTTSSSSSLHYDSDDIQYFDADTEQSNVGEKRKLVNLSIDEDIKQDQTTDEGGAGQENTVCSNSKRYQGRSVEQRNLLSGKLIRRYISLSKASDATGVCRKKITDCCARGVNDTPYLWAYAADPSIIQTNIPAPTAGLSSRSVGKRLSFPPDYFSNSRPSDITSSSSSGRGRSGVQVQVLDKREETQTQNQTQNQSRNRFRCVEQYHPLTGKLLHVYPSLQAATDAMQVTQRKDIARCCGGGTKNSAEFVWRYSARTMTDTINKGLPDVRQLLKLKNELSSRSVSDKRKDLLRWTKVDGTYKFIGDVCSADKGGEEEEDEEKESKDDEVVKEKEVTDEVIEVEWCADRGKKGKTDRREKNMEVIEVDDVEEVDSSDSSSEEDEPLSTSTHPPPKIRHCTLPRPVEQLDALTGVVLRRYESMKHATRIMKLNSGMVRKCCVDPTLTTGNFKWRESKIPSSKTWNMGSKPIPDLLRIRFGTENVVRKPKSPVSSDGAIIGNRSSGVSGDGIVHIKQQKMDSSSFLNAFEDRLGEGDSVCDADPSRAVVEPTTDGGDQSGDQSGEEVDGESDSDSDGMSEFWLKRFLERDARGKRLSETRCAYQVMSSEGELRLSNAENEEQEEERSGGENDGEEMDEE